MALMPNPPAYEYGRLGALWLKLPNVAAAESVLLKGLAKDPYCYACHLELGEVYVRTNKLMLARCHFEWVIRFFPDSDPAAFTSLVVIDRFLNDMESARSVLNEGLRLFPHDAGLLRAQEDLGA
jgi:tetratricopeptide (TPR) repeat protein